MHHTVSATDRGPAADTGLRTRRQRAAVAGIVLTVAACACFALLDAATKLVSVGVPLWMALWLR